ncbi:hypothetical protein L593_14130 [Salinarchaeum sp. Harcht-Bsk1]|uniref:EMC6-like membrane protein n=1 Tax=Salinarchaeum sp. Harcht-Bsk1 TaxID=1333523 RepID=UPI0003423DC9|nr:hypothetical protein [Salinarchaeum sp. Harcht-Bsk1]AGN02765.1 hypothetical protein L593_14130 [Salinarchaeum sp. Harcht-Bsk1]
MSEEVEERQTHVRAIAITSTAALAGVIAAIVSQALTSGMSPGAAAGSRDAQFALLAIVAVQLPVYHFVFEDWGGFKDVLYVAFMTFILWFVTWGVILTSDASIV